MCRQTTTLLLAGALWVGPAAFGAERPDLANEVRATTDEIFSATAGGPGDAVAALTRVVDIAARTAREARVEPAVLAKVEAARAATRSSSPLDEAARAAVGTGYAALGNGRAFEFPPSVESPDQARIYARGQVDRILAALAAGRGREAAREMLGLVLLVATPREAKQ